MTIDIQKVKHILIVRTDNIGDVVITLPLVGILKSHFPDITLSFLARDYVKSVVEQCAHIDRFYSWDTLNAMREEAAIAFIKAQHFDAVVHVFPNRKIARLMRKANVRYRIGTLRRIYHWWNCNVRLNFSRAKSDLHEAQLNARLLEAFSVNWRHSLPALIQKMGLKVPENVSPLIQSLLKPDRFNLITHPFTNGHTREWPLSHFIALVQQLPKDRIHIMITGSSNEKDRIDSQIMPYCENVTNLAGKLNLQEFMQLISKADGLFANATGPLHLAAAFHIHALGLFPATPGIDINRWGPLGNKAQTLSADPNCQNPICQKANDCLCMESITVDHVKQIILSWVM